MATKNTILELLEKNRGTSISGEALATAAAVSRNAVWKAIRSLKEEGYRIEAVPNKGYCLKAENDILSADGILPYLNEALTGWGDGVQIHVYKSVESTNLTAKQLAAEGAPAGTVVLAETQTKGRGRMGRSFYSPSGTGLYMSVILRPALTAQNAVLLTTAAAVGISRAIEAVTGIRAQIKWVNDIYVSDRKICGILTEAVTDLESGGIDSIVIGAGINFTVDEGSLPPELLQVIGSLYGTPEEAADKKGRAVRNQLAAEILNEFSSLEDQISTRSFLREYRERLFILGKRVRVIHFKTEFEAEAVDIDQNGGLVVLKDDGTTAVLNSGEISIKRIDGSL